MSRTRKGSKGPGWEPWSNLRERQEERANFSIRDYLNDEEERERLFEYRRDQEATEAYYCHLYGPCDRCKERDE